MNLGKTKCLIDHEVLTALAYVVMLALASIVRTRLDHGIKICWEWRAIQEAVPLMKRNF